jgi:hypothetical protein
MEAKHETHGSLKSENQVICLIVPSLASHIPIRVPKPERFKLIQMKAVNVPGTQIISTTNAPRSRSKVDPEAISTVDQTW